MRGWRNWQTRRTKDPVTALGREGSSPSLRIGKELASASSLFFEIGIVKNIQDSFFVCFLFSFKKCYNIDRKEGKEISIKKI